MASRLRLNRAVTGVASEPSCMKLKRSFARAATGMCLESKAYPTTKSAYLCQDFVADALFPFRRIHRRHALAAVRGVAGRGMVQHPHLSPAAVAEVERGQRAGGERAEWEAPPDRF